MKKILTVLLCGLILFNLTGCFSTEELESGVTDIEGNSKFSFAINETAVFDDVYYTVTNVSYSKGNAWNQPGDGKEYVIVTIKIENKSDSKISYNPYDWTMVNSQGQEDNETFTTINNDTSLGSGELISGGTKTGTMVFEQLKDDSSLKLLYYSNSLFDENASFEFIIK